MPNHSQGHATSTRLLHWIVAAAVLGMIAAGFLMIQQGLISRSLQDALFIAHKNTGVILMVFVALRLINRWRHPGPPLPASIPGWQQAIAHGSHILLYGLIVVMPIAGYVRVRAGGFPIELLDRLGIGSFIPRSDALANAAKAVHEVGAYAIAALIALHIGAALHHTFILRDGLLARIWPPVAPRR